MKQNEIQKENPLKVEMIDVKDLKVGDRVVIDINGQVKPEWVLEVEKIEQPEGYENTDTYWVDFVRDYSFPKSTCMRSNYDGWVLVVR